MDTSQVAAHFEEPGDFLINKLSSLVPPKNACF